MQHSNRRMRLMAARSLLSPPAATTTSAAGQAPVHRPGAHGVMALQRSSGNRAVTRLLGGLSVSSPRDRGELEAEQLADRALHSTVRHEDRAAAPADPSDVRRSADVEASPPRAAGAQLHALAGTGQPLPAAVRSFFEPRFGADFSAVRVHTDPPAGALATTLAASAFTWGPHIAFAPGRFAPDTSGGRRLLAHELAHVAQQSPGAGRAHGAAPAAARERPAAAIMRTVDPAIANAPANSYVDMFREAYYDLDYRAEGGNLSTWLTLEYADGTLIDVNIYEFLESDTPLHQVTTEMSNGYLGIGNRIFPRRLTRQTAPRLWAAREAAIEVMEEYNYEFMMTALPAVFFILSMTGSATLVARPTASARPGSAATRIRLRQRAPRRGSGGTRTPPTTVPPVTTGAAARQAVGFTRHARGAPQLGGFRAGISEAEIAAINRQFGGVTTITGHPSSALAAAARQQGFWRKVAAIVREVAGRHMFNDANKRTATAIVQELQRRNQVVTGVSGSTLRGVIGRVARGELRTIEEIAVALRGF